MEKEKQMEYIKASMEKAMLSTYDDMCFAYPNSRYATRYNIALEDLKNDDASLFNFLYEILKFYIELKQNNNNICIVNNISIFENGRFFISVVYGHSKLIGQHLNEEPNYFDYTYFHYYLYKEMEVDQYILNIFYRKYGICPSYINKALMIQNFTI